MCDAFLFLDSIDHICEIDHVETQTCVINMTTITFDQMCDYVLSHRDVTPAIVNDDPDDIRDELSEYASSFNDTVSAMYASCNVTFDDDAMHFNDATSLDSAYAIATEIFDAYNNNDDAYETKFDCEGDDDVDYQSSFAMTLIDIARAMIA